MSGVTLELDYWDRRVCWCVYASVWLCWESQLVLQPSNDRFHWFRHSTSLHTHRQTHTHTQVLELITGNLCWETDRGGWSLQCIVWSSDREVERILFQFPYLPAELWPCSGEMRGRKMEIARGKGCGKGTRIKVWRLNAAVLFSCCPIRFRHMHGHLQCYLFVCVF